MMTPTHTLSPLDVLLASQLSLQHDIAAITTIGAACRRCLRLLDAEAWSAPCEPAMLPSQPLAIGPAEAARG